MSMDSMNPLGQRIDRLQQSLIKLRAYGYVVEPVEFGLFDIFPPPVTGMSPMAYYATAPKSGARDLTSRQVISFADQL